MSLLQTSDLLQSLTFQHAKTRQSLPDTEARICDPREIGSKASIARLVQFARHRVENVTEALEDWYDGTTKAERDRRQSLEDRKQLLYLKLRESSSASEWQATATGLDLLEGNNDWKSLDDSPDYDASLVLARLKQLDEARISCDVG
ncbi:MAG: hypothetical protein Q9198_010015, partial [Flavoplaca austrocitrina]